MKFPVIVFASLLLGACSEDIIGPVHVDCDSFLLQFGAAVGDTVQTPAGLRYIDIRTGTGDAASTGMLAEVNYSGYLLNGTRFDTSCPASRTVIRATIGGSETIAGFQMGIAGMRPGGVRRVIIPPSLGYGNTANGSIPANSTLIFDLQLVGFAR
jgi:FKBP-type peptidyl-prolyl cis-trans isomerase